MLWLNNNDDLLRWFLKLSSHHFGKIGIGTIHSDIQAHTYSNRKRLGMGYDSIDMDCCIAWEYGK
jgi:hypothetical protein